MTEEEFNAALKLEDSTAWYTVWREDGKYRAKILSWVQRPNHDKPIWVTRLATAAYDNPDYAVYVLINAFIQHGIPPL